MLAFRNQGKAQRKIKRWPLMSIARRSQRESRMGLMLIMRLEIKDFGKCSIRFRQLYKQKETARACRFFLFINYVTVYAFVPERV